MANIEHLNWLLEGAEKWNARREQYYFEPDLENANLYTFFQQKEKLDENGYIPLSNFDLRHANFRKAILTDEDDCVGADLRNANLSYSDFRDAHMAYSILDGTQIQFAGFEDAILENSVFGNVQMFITSFKGAHFSQANLEGTKFKNAFLNKADLSNAALSNADLSRANLRGVDFRAAEPWRAKLFEEYQFVSEMNANSDSKSSVGCVAQLIEECKNIQSDHFDHVLYFRGESRTEDENGPWKLKPSIMRNPVLRSNERNMLLDLMSRRPEDFIGTNSALSQWVIAQHHGLKTRLLDITRNPLVALFNVTEELSTDGRLHVFAVPRSLVKPYSSDTIRVITNFAKLSRREQMLLLGFRDWSTVHELSITNDRVGTYSITMDRLYDLIRQEKSNFEEKIDPKDFFRVFVVEPQQSFVRISPSLPSSRAI